MKYFNLVWLSGLATTLLISCDTKRNPYFGDDEAQFYVGSIEQHKKPKKTVNSDGKVYKKEITFKACMKALSGDSLPATLKFEIQAGSEIRTDVTDKDGCIEWTEEHSFDPVADERNIRLRRTFISKNEYAGKRSEILYWNPITDDLETSIESKTEPQRTEDPLQDGFVTTDINTTIQSTVNTTQGNGGPGSDIVPGSDSQNPAITNQTRLVLTSIALTRVKLNQEMPYRIDKNLTLYAQHTYQVSATPKFYVHRFDNPNSEENPPGGTYKLTLVFMDDPRIDLEKLSTELGLHQTVESIRNSSSTEGRRLKLAADLLVSNKEITPGTALTEPMKKQILAKAMLAHVHATAQFIADKKAEQDIEKYIDLQLKKLASLDVRSVLAVTVENISSGQKQKLKGHGIGYVNNLLDPGTITLMQTPIEADQLFREYVTAQAQNESLRPLDMFLQASTMQLKERALAPLDMRDLSPDELRQPLYPKKSYSFNQEFESFLVNSKDPAKKALFLRALCAKLFLNDDLKAMDTRPQPYFGQSRESWVQRCTLDQPLRLKYFNVAIVDFVESVEGVKVSKVGQSVKENITISRSFEVSESSSQSQGKKFDASLSNGDWRASLGNHLVDGTIAIITASNPLVGAGLKAVKEFFPISSGGSWYYGTSREKSKSQSASVSRESSQSLSINVDTYKINPETRRCAIVTYEPWVVKYFSESQKINLRKGFFACAAKTLRPDYFEKYYMVTQECSESNGTTDCASSDETRLRMMLRGESTYKQFNDIVMDSKLSFMLDPVESNAMEQQRMQWTTLMDSIMTSQVFPGAIVPAQ